jgi:hypothetical protein
VVRCHSTDHRYCRSHYDDDVVSSPVRIVLLRSCWYAKERDETRGHARSWTPRARWRPVCSSRSIAPTRPRPFTAAGMDRIRWPLYAAMCQTRNNSSLQGHWWSIDPLATARGLPAAAQMTARCGDRRLKSSGAGRWPVSVPVAPGGAMWASWIFFPQPNFEGYILILTF